MLAGALICTLLATPSGESWPPPLQPQQVPPEIYFDQAGLPEVVIQSSVLGAFVGGGLTNAIFGKSDPVRAAAGFPLGVAGGIAIPFAVFNTRPLHQSDAVLYNFGERWGLSMGL